MDLRPVLLRQKQRLLTELELIQSTLSAEAQLADKPVYANLPPGKAIRKFLAYEGRLCDRATIIWNLIAGQANVGTKDPEQNINRAIDVNLQLGLLREFGGKIALAEWEYRETQADRAARDPRVRQVVRTMHSELDKSFSIEHLAEGVQLSPSRLSRLFQQEMRMRPCEYLRRIKMRVFCHMAKTSMLKQKQILPYIGITDRSHFSRQFTRMFGRSPSDLRKRS